VARRAAAPLARGAELGRFNLGSTVVVLFGRNAVRWDGTLAPGAAAVMGRALGHAGTPATGGAARR
jgi:phosphatidylserine decarboxylase